MIKSKWCVCAHCCFRLCCRFENFHNKMLPFEEIKRIQEKVANTEDKHRSSNIQIIRVSEDKN